MKFVDEFRNSYYAKGIIKSIKNITDEKINIMEVCGTHTSSIFKYGLRDVLPSNIKLISGPGCPVCVTPENYIDAAVQLSHIENVIIATFGDMMKVPGKASSLIKSKSEGNDVRIVYSPMDALTLAIKNPSKNIVLLSIGFETTTPMTAVTAIEAKKSHIKNLFFLTSHKLVTPVLKNLLEDKDLHINAFLLPGHVSAIIGEKPYNFLPDNYKIPGVITGFEAVDILQSIKIILQLIHSNTPKIVNCYKRIVKYEGNVNALEYMKKVFKVVDSSWRGIGIIPNSGYELNEDYKMFDAVKHFKLKLNNYTKANECKCGEILKGKVSPIECPLFKKICTIENPIGPCMVSSEGTCSTYYKYNNWR
ncbi:hydrogenase formation protein HypD [Clostridium sp. P21]|uniref:Hydrogenase formation protein HypD n=1 Tax=Clostridium muellerianum TaxID=2716538 RepID=A0A7Y0HQ80_9CLOT|nr:hydrogenase formation protein HypD [Clostridium muellerianum]NMM63841.1 hydrogenase formation protein HypD [Clostridium muellerianum]